MAVYQISKIQIRRGRARTGPGFPQLASGEMGWAVDSQELYIGNGSVAEGAPSVGNTKILTSKDLSSGENGLISLLQHTYKVNDTTFITGQNANFPIVRALQDVLDDNVNSASFGAKGTGDTDDSLYLQKAITQLFANPLGKSFNDTYDGIRRRVTLRLPAGIFRIDNTLELPSYTTIVGAGIDKTIIQYTGTTIAMKCIADVDSSNPITQPRNITIQGITIQALAVNTTVLDITNVLNSTFDNIKVIGQWTSANTPTNVGINIANTSHSTFTNITVSNCYYGINIGDTTSNINIDTGHISYTKYGIGLGIGLNVNSNTGPTNTTISNIDFNNIQLNAIVNEVGSNNIFDNNSMNNVGGNNLSPIVPQIYIATVNNRCSNTTSDRYALSDISSSVKYLPVVSGSNYETSTNLILTVNTNIVSSTPLFRLPLPASETGTTTGSISYKVNYTFSGAFIRHGTIDITSDSSNISSSEDYTCNTTSDNGIKLNFTAAISNNSIVVSYTNTYTSNAGTFTYSYTAIS